MSQSVNPYLVLDDRLNINDSVHFAVQKGGQSINQQVFTAQTATASNISVNCLIPSLSTVIDKRVLLKTQMAITITGSPGNGAYLVATNGSDFCLANFPVSHAVNTASVQINNTVVNGNYQDQLDLILRQISRKGLSQYSDLCPVDRDFYLSLAQAGTQSPFNNLLTAPDRDVLPRGAWVLDSVAGNAVGDGSVRNVVLTFTTTEPIFISPFSFGDGALDAQSGLSGISSMNFNFNLVSTPNRVCRWLNASNTANCTITMAPVSSSILMTFISAPPSVMIPLTNCQPYWELPCFKTTIPGAAGQTVGTSKTQITSSIITPNCIPDKVIIAVRKQAGNFAYSDSDFLFPIDNVNITWGTQSGILSNATPQDLYYMSKKAGLEMGYQEWRGVGKSNAIATASDIYLAGGCVVLDFAQHIALMEDYYAPSSLGSFTFSATVTFLNTYNATLPQCELVVGFLNSGLFTCTSGTSQQYIGILDKSTVLSTSQDTPLSITEHNRLLGGSFLSKLKSALPVVKTVANALAPMAKDALSKSGSKVANLASSALGLAGYGYSAGAMSAGRKPRIH